VSSNTELPPQGRQLSPPRDKAPLSEFTLRDLYVRASISGNSMAAELGRYLNINESTFSNLSQKISSSNGADAAPTVHEQALSAILEVVTATPKPTSQYVRTPAPQGGVQEWWARMISGSVKPPVGEEPTPPTTVTVTFNGGDSGTGSMANETFTIGVPQALSTNGLVRPGYTFLYWDTFADANTPGNVAYAPGQVVTLSANTTLYAQWVKNP
jgi:hypothetical protein